MFDDNFNCLLLGNCIEYVEVVKELSTSIVYEEFIVNLIFLQVNGALEFFYLEN